ncbi:MAG: DUF3365 domain-containing protein [Chitinophagales bacterium]|nr:DUF3365 domain-containing protein [Chitinophagales bacterium]
MRYLAMLPLALLLNSCGNTPQSVSTAPPPNYTALGDSITTEIQQVFMQRVSAAMQQGGSEHAVTYCNIHAMPITDSLSNIYHASIQRLSNKNRNPLNAINATADSLAWKKIETQKVSFAEQKNEGEVVYYKPIFLAMPACIKCHGNTSDITEGTQVLLKQKYPNDLATGYSLGELRGMWKIKFKTN